MKTLAKMFTLVALAGVAFSSAQAAEYTLKIAHNGPEQHPYQNGALMFKATLEKITSGAVEVQIFPGEQLGSEEETSQMIKQIGMGGSLPQKPEVIGGRNEPPAEQVMPQTIDQYPGDKRITFGISDLTG